MPPYSLSALDEDCCALFLSKIKGGSGLDETRGDMFQVRIMFRFFSIRVKRWSIIAGLMLAPAIAHAGAHPTIRVAILKGVSAVTVQAARGNLAVRDRAGASEWRGREATIRVVEDSLRLNGKPVAGDEMIIEAKPALYYIGRDKFRGRLHVYVDEADSLLVVDELDIEDYLAGLINSEISSNWPIEAVKAQAIAARTYALHQISGANRHAPVARYDVESTVADQVYHGAHREDRRAYEGVRATTGMVLTRGGVVFPAFYHSTCGGYTENAHNVWTDMTSSPAIVDRYCRYAPYGEWFLRIPRTEFLAVMTRAGVLKPHQLLVDVRRLPLPDSPRVDEVVFGTDGGEVRVKATKLRHILGYKRLKSTWFNVGLEGDEVVFARRGFGHGVGLCQWGAKGMAEAGYTYKEILKHYYNDAEIGRMY